VGLPLSVGDLKPYNDGFTHDTSTDVSMHGSTDTFPAHKVLSETQSVILKARHPSERSSFKMMTTNEGIRG
jgi:hypothetical protein